MTRPVLAVIDRSGFADLAVDWDRMIADSPGPGVFLSWAWISAWLDTLGRDADLQMVAARDPDDGRLVGAAPFFIAESRRLGIPYRALRLVGSGPLAPDHLDMPIAAGAPDDTAQALWDRLHHQVGWDLLDLDGVVPGGVVDRLSRRRRHDDAAVEAIPMPYLPLAPTWDATAVRFGTGHRENLGRYRRKLDREAGAPVIERMVVDREEVLSTIRTLEDLHQRVQTAAGHRGLFATPLQREFHEAVTRRMHDAGRLRLWRLDVGDHPIAIIECFRFGDTVSFYTTGYDPDWSRYGPGRRIMAAAISGAIDEGATEFDFLRGDEPYKASWGTEMRHGIRIRRPASRRGRLLWAGRRLLTSRRRGS